MLAVIAIVSLMLLLDRRCSVPKRGAENEALGSKDPRDCSEEAEALMTQFGASHEISATAGATGALFMMCTGTLMTFPGSLNTEQRDAIRTLEADGNELFFLLMRKVNHLANERGVRSRYVLRDHTLTEINNMVDDSAVAKGTELYPQSEAGSDYEDDDTEYHPAYDPDVLAGEITRWVDDRYFGIITVDDEWSNATPSARTYFFHCYDTEGNEWNCEDLVGGYVYFYEHYDKAKQRWCAKQVLLDLGQFGYDEQDDDYYDAYEDAYDEDEDY